MAGNKKRKRAKGKEKMTTPENIDARVKKGRFDTSATSSPAPPPIKEGEGSNRDLAGLEEKVKEGKEREIRSTKKSLIHLLH